MNAAQHSPASRDLPRAPDPWESAKVMIVGDCAFSGSFRGLELAPAKWRYLVPPAGNANR